MAEVEQQKKDLIKKRGSIKAKLTIFSNHLREVLEKESLCETDIINLEQRVIRFEDLLSEFDNCQSALELIIPDAEIEDQYIERATFEEAYFSALSSAKKVVSDNQATNIGSGHSDSGGSENASNINVNSHTSNSQLKGVRLPVINLPSYDGTLDQWLQYRDTYESLIHANSTLSDIQKYHYLRASLQGEALQTIQSLELCSTNYKIAWDTLIDRYNNNSLLVHIHTKALFTIEQIQKESSFKLRHVVDLVSKNLMSLAQLKQPTDKWDTLIIYMVTSKLDNATNRAWEQHKSSKNISESSWDDLKQFLKDRANMLETVAAKNADKNVIVKKEQISSKVKGFHITNTNKCIFCKNDHMIYNCDKFLKIPVEERIQFVRKSKLCTNCLQNSHFVKTCRSKSCKHCEKRHNSILCLEKAQQSLGTTSDEKTEDNNSQPNVALTSSVSEVQQVLLSTILVTVLDKYKNEHTVRALLDSGSQSSFVTSNLAQTLSLDKIKTDSVICGLNNTSSRTQYKCNISIKSKISNFSSIINCFVVPQISSNLPNVKVDKRLLNIPRNIKLADPTFNVPSQIDILIGADLFWKTLCVGQIHLGRNSPVLHKTRFGWVISGCVHSAPSKQIKCHFSTNVQDIDNQLTKFWAIEECVQSSKSLSIEEEACEQHFRDTVKRNDDGRFVVSMPLKEPASNLGESRIQAQRRFFSLERKLENNRSFKEQYINFMREYEDLGHLTPVNEFEDKSETKVYYMPHHGIEKTSLTTSLRVVFDASAATSSGKSLNDIQMVGPTIQDGLIDILLRFRIHKYVVSADIAKMYRQVQISPEQRSLQRIFWRESPSDPLQVYNLNTVTYGQASAPFLATRCLIELANQCESQYPEIAEIIRHSFYVDDLLFSVDSINKASYICENIQKVLNGGCFQLRKWFSNEPEILKNISKSDLSYSILDFGKDNNAKTLGLIWNCSLDMLMYQVDISSEHRAVTKRTILSHISQLFDPLGLLSACTILVKIMIQKLWLAKVSWDESLPSDIHHSWIAFKGQLQELNSLQISRHVVCENPVLIEVHGFCDSSELAYGSCIFIRSLNCHGEVFTHLLCAKSKVAPIKSQTLPRLELCGALLLARLTNKVHSTLNLQFSRICLWTDSSIVLGWIRTSPHLLKTFVSNRVAEIQRLTGSFEWRHVPSKDNPADLVSRGVYPSQIKHERIWWSGPSFLKYSEQEWPDKIQGNTILPDIRKQKMSNLLTTTQNIFPFDKYSSLVKLKRIVAYIMRFKSNCSKPRSERTIGPLTTIEIDNALLSLVRLSQMESFSLEYNDLQQHVSVHHKSKLCSLNPFIDERGIIRVGGRLANSNFQFDKKHPMLLCSKHKLTKLIFKDEHIRLLHVGPQALLASIREKFWPISGRNLSKVTVRNCITCFKWEPKITKPIMGNLPSSRFVVDSPFYISGVDYAGPFNIKNHKGRNAKLSKCYLCLFVCFATKAVHMELVTDLTSDNFILALRRFAARRGKPAHIYSDNGLNFVKANKDLKALGDYLVSQKEHLENQVSQEGIQWHFIPVNSPHFGGLWESGVKCTKFHLKRVVGNASLTFEELYSVLVQIEAVLNSRPLCPLSADPNDLTPLTPAHFIIGKSLTSLPDPSVQHIPENRLSRFQRIQQLRQHFWERWNKEYVSELQQRQRWKVNQSQLQLGTLVVIKEDNLPPNQWRLGRIVQIHPGKDKVCRVASIKCSSGVIKRSFAKICPLPMDS